MSLCSERVGMDLSDLSDDLSVSDKAIWIRPNRYKYVHCEVMLQSGMSFVVIINTVWFFALENGQKPYFLLMERTVLYVELCYHND